MTVKIPPGDIVLMANGSGVQELYQWLYQTQRTVKGMKERMPGVLNDY